MAKLGIASGPRGSARLRRGCTPVRSLDPRPYVPEAHPEGNDPEAFEPVPNGLKVAREAVYLQLEELSDGRRELNECHSVFCPKELQHEMQEAYQTLDGIMSTHIMPSPLRVAPAQKKKGRAAQTAAYLIALKIRAQEKCHEHGVDDKLRDCINDKNRHRAHVEQIDALLPWNLLFRIIRGHA